jgi:hypothetical protein
MPGKSSKNATVAPCSHDGTRTYAFVEAIDELGQGEDMFVSEGLKISPQAEFVERSAVVAPLSARMP